MSICVTVDWNFEWAVVYVGINFMGLVFEGAWIFFGTGIVFGALARARIYLYMGCSIYEKISKSRYLTLHISEPFWPRNLNFFLWCRVHLKIYQKYFEVFPTSGTWVTRGLKIWISAILIDLYISIASKPQYVGCTAIYSTCNMPFLVCSSVV